MRYSMDQPVTNNYQTYHQPGPAQVRPNVPQMYSQSQNNVQIRQYNVPGSPRLQIGKLIFLVRFSFTELFSYSVIQIISKFY